jgi:hypothetical protein
LRLSLLAAALLVALVWILRLMARRLIRVLAGLGGLTALSILLTILVGIMPGHNGVDVVAMSRRSRERFSLLEDSFAVSRAARE